MPLVIEDGAPGEVDGSGATIVGLPDHGLAVVGGVCVGGGVQLWRWGEALRVAGFPLQSPVGSRPREERGNRQVSPAWNRKPAALPSCSEWVGLVAKQLTAPDC